MESWTKLARIVKVTKNLDFVADFVTKSFFASRGVQDLVSKQVFIVPPITDICRCFKIKNVSIQQKHVVFTFDKIYENDNASFDLSQFAGKFLLIKQSVLEMTFSDLTYLDLNYNRIVGLDVVDKQLGFIGNVTSIEGTQAQKRLVVKHQAEDILIPYVKDIILSIDNSIHVDLPVGLIDVNK